jgi:hypothetical protein
MLVAQVNLLVKTRADTPSQKNRPTGASHLPQKILAQEMFGSAKYDIYVHYVQFVLGQNSNELWTLVTMFASYSEICHNQKPKKKQSQAQADLRHSKNPWRFKFLSVNRC